MIVVEPIVMGFVQSVFVIHVFQRIYPFNLSCHIYWYKIFIISNYQLILYGIYNGVLYFILDVGSLSLPLFIFISLTRHVSILLTFSVEYHLVLLVHSMLFLCIQFLFFIISFLLLILSFLSLICSSSFFNFLMQEVRSLSLEFLSFPR